jgi:hypothetical protein
VWAADGSALFYRDDDQMIAVRIESGEPEGAPIRVFEGQYYGFGVSGWPGGELQYDVAHDGRFLMNSGFRASPQIAVVEHWFEDLKRLVPTN